MSLEKSFKGKQVLVTGAGSGIGRAVVKRLHEYGAKVFAVSKTPEKLNSLKNECPLVETITCDLSNWEETREKLSKIQRVDFLLNNAAVGVVKAIMNSTPEEYEQAFQLNVKGSLNVSQIIGKKMIEEGKGGSITFISSIAGGKPFNLFGMYSMSKAAVESLANCLAVELGTHKIRVNVVRPASVETDLLTIAETGVDKALGAVDAFKSHMLSRTPFPGYHMEMESLVNLILFTMSDLCPQMTGTSIWIDGGFHLT